MIYCVTLTSRRLIFSSSLFSCSLASSMMRLSLATSFSSSCTLLLSRSTSWERRPDWPSATPFAASTSDFSLDTAVWLCTEKDRAKEVHTIYSLLTKLKSGGSSTDFIPTHKKRNLPGFQWPPETRLDVTLAYTKALLPGTDRGDLSEWSNPDNLSSPFRVTWAWPLQFLNGPAPALLKTVLGSLSLSTCCLLSVWL